MRCRLLAAVVLCASALVARTAHAQCTANATTATTTTSLSLSLCMHVNDVLLLTIDANSSLLGTPKMVNYGPLATYASSATPLAALSTRAITVTANRAYDLSISAPQATFGPSGVNKPIGDIQWKVDAGAFLPIGTTATSFGLAGATGTSSATLSFRSRWAFERDVPGSYSTTIVLTLSAR